MSAEIVIQSALGADITQLFPTTKNLYSGITALPTVKLKNTGDATPATTQNFSVSCVNWQYSGQAANQGQEPVTEKWIEAKVGLGAWTPVGGDAWVAGNFLSITPLAPAATVDVELRTNIPVGFSTSGNWSAIPEVAFDA